MRSQGIRIVGDLNKSELKVPLAFFKKGSSSSARFSMFRPKAHLAMTSMVKMLKILYKVRSNQSTDRLLLAGNMQGPTF